MQLIRQILATALSVIIIAPIPAGSAADKISPVKPGSKNLDNSKKGSSEDVSSDEIDELLKKLPGKDDPRERAPSRDDEKEEKSKSKDGGGSTKSEDKEQNSEPAEQSDNAGSSSGGGLELHNPAESTSKPSKPKPEDNNDQESPYSSDEGQDSDRSNSQQQSSSQGSRKSENKANNTKESGGNSKLKTGSEEQTKTSSAEGENDEKSGKNSNNQNREANSTSPPEEQKTSGKGEDRTNSKNAGSGAKGDSEGGKTNSSSSSGQAQKSSGQAKDKNKSPKTPKPLSDKRRQFVINELQMVLTKEDDISLGELTESGKYFVMSGDDYINHFWREFDKALKYKNKIATNRFMKMRQNAPEKSNVMNYLALKTDYNYPGLPTASYKIKELSFEAIRQGNTEDLRALQNNYDISNIRDENGNNLLAAAIIYERPDIAKMLLMQGFNDNSPNNEGRTPYILAYNSHNPEIQFLYKYIGAGAKKRMDF